jgi:hypothetical protein
VCKTAIREVRKQTTLPGLASSLVDGSVRVPSFFSPVSHWGKRDIVFAADLCQTHVGKIEFLASVRIGVHHTFSYTSARVRRILAPRIEASHKQSAVLWIDKADHWRSEKLDNVSSTLHAVADSYNVVRKELCQQHQCCRQKYVVEPVLELSDRKGRNWRVDGGFLELSRREILAPIPDHGRA